MPRISNLVPLPGVPELESLGRWFINHLKNAGFENDRRAALARRLECLIERTKLLKDPARLTSQLLEIQRRFQAADVSGSRIGIRVAQRKLALWDELSMRLDETVEESMFELIAQIEQAQVQQAEIQQLQLHQAATRSRQPKVKIVDSYDIKNQVEIRRRNAESPTTYPRSQPSEEVKTTLRTGRFGKLSVAYMTFASDSQDTAHQCVEQELEHVSRSLHVNIAQLVGATEGYVGMNGIVVVMDGIEFEHFHSKPHSGVVWAKCIRGFEDFQLSYPLSLSVRRVTVTPDGHVTMFPFSPFLPKRGGVHSRFWEYRHVSEDSAVSLLGNIYLKNDNSAMESNLRLFVDTLTELGLAFTKLQVMRLAGSFGMLPEPRAEFFGEGKKPIPSMQPEFGEFGRATYKDGELTGWEALENSHYLKVRDQDRQSRLCDTLGASESPASNGNWWHTHTLCRVLGYPALEPMYHRGEGGERFCWGDIFIEAQNISQHLEVDLDSIALCSGTNHSVKLKCPKSTSWSEVPETVYYHRNPSSQDPREVTGFASVNEIPDNGEWETQMRQRGWHFDFKMYYCTYSMMDDWGRVYEREVQKGIATMPGSYPRAHIDEVLE